MRTCGPALRVADLVIVPVAASQVDVWATESVLDLAKREGRPVMIVLNRAKQGTRVLDEVGKSLDSFEVLRSDAMLGNRVAYAETLGQGLGVLERGRGAWTAEVEGLAAEVRAALAGLKRPYGSRMDRVWIPYGSHAQKRPLAGVRSVHTFTRDECIRRRPTWHR